MFHVHSRATVATEALRKGAGDPRAYYRIQGLPGRKGKEVYSWSHPDSRRPLTEFPNTWLLQTPDGLGYCVATSIGPRSVLTAAHCVVPGAAYELEQGVGSRPARSATCVHMPRYEPPACPEDEARQARDLAVCTVQGEGTLSVAGGRYETPDTGSVSAPAGRLDVVTFTACEAGLPTDEVNPIELDAESWPTSGGMARASGNAVTRLCSGDSGGPWLMRDPGSDARFAAIHTCRERSKSKGVPLDSAEARQFLKSQDAIAPLCGFSADVSLCRR